MKTPSCSWQVLCQSYAHLFIWSVAESSCWKWFPAFLFCWIFFFLKHSGLLWRNSIVFDHFLWINSQQAVRWADELPAEVWRQDQVLGRTATSGAMWATLGGALQHLHQHLPPQSVRCSGASHQSSTLHPWTCYPCWSPAAADQRGWTRGCDPWLVDRQCYPIWSLSILNFLISRVTQGAHRVNKH